MAPHVPALVECLMRPRRTQVSVGPDCSTVRGRGSGSVSNIQVVKNELATPVEHCLTSTGRRIAFPTRSNKKLISSIPCVSEIVADGASSGRTGRGVQRSDRRTRPIQLPIGQGCEIMVVSTACTGPCARARGLLPFPSCGEDCMRWPGPLLLALSLVCGLPAAASPAARRSLSWNSRAAIDDEARMTLSDSVRSGVLDASRGATYCHDSRKHARAA